MIDKSKIEAYFDKGLTEAEQQELLQELETNADLKAEFEFQREMIEGINAYRKQELINRLNNVKVVSAGQSAWLKGVGIITAAAIISGAAYWFNNQGSQSKPVTEIDQTIQEPANQQSEVVDIPAKNQEQGTTVQETVVEEKPAPKEEVNENNAQTNAPVLPDIDVPEMSEPAGDNSSIDDANLNIPESIASADISIKSTADVEIRLDKKFNFHYQVKNGDLILFGNFNDSPFEVIELKTTKGICTFLYYKEYYYELKDDSEEIRPLVAIDNEALISELKKRR